MIFSTNLSLLKTSTCIISFFPALIFFPVKSGHIGNSLPPLAGLIKKAILKNFKINCEIGYVDMTFYRDDPFAVRKAADATELPFDINNKEAILVDDVISSGRTVRASIDEIFD